MVGQKTSALYTFHSYWSKKDPSLIQKYVEHYTQPGDLILDPFCGSGTTGLAALLERRVPILIDASPSAALLSHFCCMAASPYDVEITFQRLIDEAGQEVDKLFMTKCDRCGGDAITEFVVWSERYQCPNCAELVPLFDCPEEKVEYPTGGRGVRVTTKKRAVCPYCLKKNNGRPHRDFVISTRTKKFGAVPVLVRYKCLEGCKPAVDARGHKEKLNTQKQQFFENYDLSEITRIDVTKIPYWYPIRKMMDVEDDNQPWGVKWRAGSSSFRTVAELYTRRNLYALSTMKAAVEKYGFSNLETLFFTGLLHKCSTLMGYRSDGVGRVTTGTYYIPPMRMECRPTKYMAEALSDLKRHFEVKSALGYRGGDLCLSVGDARRELKRIPENTIDYVFTDPPYMGKIQYGEMNFLWEAWLGFDGAWLNDEIVVNPYRNKNKGVSI